MTSSAQPPTQRTRLCAYCHRQCPWTWTGHHLKDGTKIYADAAGRRWAGRRCPNCERQRVRAAQRCDSFEKELVVEQLVKDGYAILSRALPLQVRKDGQDYTVVVKRASAAQGKIILESPLPPSGGDGQELVVLMFTSARVVTPEQQTRIFPNIGVSRR